MRIQREVRAVLLMLVLAGASGRVQAQLLDSLQPVLHFRTDSFDIYAPPNLESQAVRLSGFADQTYAMLCEFFGVKASAGRIPVLLSDIQYSLNGYTTLYPSNRIVILLASADPRSQLATMQDELYSVFLHELVHYVTLNERSTGWRALAWLLGDWVAPEVWMMPQALVEGTAVWAESRLGGHEAPSNASGLGRVGRLNDPAALEIVRMERAWGKERSLWDVSGLADFYGAGSLPYLYGGLFVDFLSERYGPDMLARLWQASADGNIFRGFDGTLTSRGVLERETGEVPPQLWQEFLAWVDDESTVSGAGGAGLGEEAFGAAFGVDRPVELFSGYVGAVGFGEGVLYYVDLERRGLYALSLQSIMGDAAEEHTNVQGESSGGEGGERAPKTEFLKPERLFAADENLRNIFFNVRFGALDLDWIRIDAQNQEIPARYRYDLQSRRLTYEYDLPAAEPGNALLSLQDKPENDIFLYDPWEDPETSICYGLARIGTAVLPARRLAGGRIEVASIPDSVIRWLSPGFRDQIGSEDPLRFALTTLQDKGLSRLAVLEEKEGVWQLLMAKDAPSGGLHRPVFTDDTHIVYRESKADGQAALCLLDISGRLSTPVPVEWLSPSQWTALYAPRSSEQGAESLSTPTQNPQYTVSHLRPTLFPEIFSTSRIPYANGSLVGLSLIAYDLSERLAWTAFGGWDFLSWRPALSAEVRLAVGAWQFNVYASDQGQGILFFPVPIGRKSTLGSMFVWTHTLLPSFRSFSVDLHTAFAGVQNNYSTDGFFDMAPDYYTWATGLGFKVSSAHASHRPPYDPLGGELSGTIEYESASAAGVGGISLSASASLRGRLSVSGYGAIAPAGGVVFAPAERYLETGGSYWLSAADLPYPEYREYRDFSNPSAWYVFGETQYRLFSLETGWGWILRLPFMPSFALRRVVGNLGLRGAGLDIDGKPSLLSSAFAAVDFDYALLAGLAAETHTHLTVEAAWAFQASRTGVVPLSMSIGLRTSI